MWLCSVSRVELPETTLARLSLGPVDLLKGLVQGQVVAYGVLKCSWIGLISSMFQGQVHIFSSSTMIRGGGYLLKGIG